jgi:hypothetical protein
MEKYYGNHLGICINNVDPENRGRVQVFVPHIMPALYEGWNELGEDIKLECVGNNLPNGLSSKVVEKLTKILPWCEAAMPVIGNSVAGSYNPESGNFNQTNTPETLAAPSTTPNSSTFDLNALPPSLQPYGQTFIEAGQRNGVDPGLLAAISMHETANGKSSAFRNKNNAMGISNASGPTAFSTVEESIFQQARTLGRPTGPYAGKKTISEIGAVYAPIGAGNDPGSLNQYWTQGVTKFYQQLTKNQQIDITNPASAPDASASGTSNNPFYTPYEPYQVQKQPTQEAVTQANAPTGATTRGGFENAFRNKVLGSDGRLISDKGTTLCGVGTRKAVGIALGDSYYTNTGMGVGAVDSATSGYWTAKGDFEKQSLPSTYLPRQGDVLIHSKNLGGSRYGHAQVYLDNKWHSFKTGDSATAYVSIPGQQTSLFRLTDQGKEKLINTNIADTSLVDKDGDLIASSQQKAEDSNGAENDINSQLVKNPTETQATALDTTGMPQGMFGIPGPGAMLWVFFREGDPMFPVYFAASYGAAEWQSVYKASSPAAYGPQENSSNSISNQAVFRPNNAGALTFTGAVNSEQDSRAVRMAHANGGYLEFHPYGSVHYSPNEHLNHVGGTSYSYCINREEWTQGDDNKVVIGNQWVVVGNPSQANIETIEKLTEKVKQINAEMMKN